MSVKDGEMWGALTIGNLTPDEIDVFTVASAHVYDEDERDFFVTDRVAGEVTFAGNLGALHDALCAIADEADSQEWHDVAHEASMKFHDEFTDTFGGPT